MDSRKSVMLYIDSALLARLDAVASTLEINRNSLLVGIIQEKVTECEAALTLEPKVDSHISIPPAKPIVVPKPSPVVREV